MSYDAANGPSRDTADSFVDDQIVSDIKAGDYTAAMAMPDCSTFPSMRSTTGANRYGILAELSIQEAALVRLQNLVCTRVARILNLLTDPRLPWIFETRATAKQKASVLYLDEYLELKKCDGIKAHRGTQCPFGAIACSAYGMDGTHCRDGVNASRM